MPAFLDFVFPFGFQIDERDTHFGGSRFECSIDPQDREQRLPELGRSGFGFQQCYSLKSIEPSRGNQSWPWSMRRTAIYHAFDLERGSAKWIMLKANSLLQDRVNSTVGVPEPPLQGQVANGFAMSLATHLVPCEWAAEHWRWYLSFIEQEIQTTTQRALTLEVDEQIDDFNPQTPSRVATMLSQSDESVNLISKCWNFAATCTQKSMSSERDKADGGIDEKKVRFGPNEARNFNFGRKLELEQENKISFSFEDIQQIQFIQEKVNEAGMVLGSNIDTLTAVQNQHLEVWTSESFPSDSKHACKGAFRKYQRRMAAIVQELKLHQSTVRTFLKLLADRKSIVSEWVYSKH